MILARGLFQNVKLRVKLEAAPKNLWILSVVVRSGWPGEG